MGLDNGLIPGPHYVLCMSNGIFTSIKITKTILRTFSVMKDMKQLFTDDASAQTRKDSTCKYSKLKLFDDILSQ